MTTLEGKSDSPVHISITDDLNSTAGSLDNVYDNKESNKENDEENIDNINGSHVFQNRFKRPSIKPEEPTKEISLLYGGALIINAIIGPGIFTSPKGVVHGAGSIGLTLIIWGAFGVFSTIAALCFTELRETVTREGVEYAYISEAFGPLASFVYCWMRIAAAEPVATAIFCMGFADYTMDYVYDNCGPSNLQRKVLGISAVVTLAYLNVFSSKLSEKLQILGTIGKTVALAIIIICGIIRLANGYVTELQTGFDETETNPTSITIAIYNCLWAYGGWASVNNVTKGVRKPPRNLPRLIKVAIPTVGVIFMLTVISYLTVMTKPQLVGSEAIGVTWSDEVLGKNYGAVIPLCVSLLALRSANATFIDAGKLSRVAVKDHSMPEVVSFVHVRSKTPLITVITRAMIAIIMIILGSLSSLLNFFIFIVWAFHGLSALALIVLRFKNKEMERPYKVYFVMPVIVVVVITALLITPFLEEPKIEFILAVSFFLLCCICYLPFQYLKNKQFFSADKLTIYLQLFLRIVPRNALKNKARILAEKRNYNRRMSTPETRGYLRYHSKEWSEDSLESNNNDNARKRNMFQPNEDSSVEKSLKSVLKRGYGISEHNSETCDDSDSDDVDYEYPSTDDERSGQTKSKMTVKL